MSEFASFSRCSIIAMVICTVASNGFCQRLFFYKTPKQVQRQLAPLKMDSIQYYSDAEKDSTGKYPIFLLTYTDSLFGQQGSLKIFFDRKNKWKSCQFLFDGKTSSKAMLAMLRDSIQHRFGKSDIPYANTDSFYYHFVRSGGAARTGGIVYDLEAILTLDDNNDLRLSYGPSKKIRCRVDVEPIN